MPIPNDRLRSLRRRTGLKPGKFAALVECSAAHLRGCENGWRDPSPELAVRIAREAGWLLRREVDVDEFMPRDGTPDRPPPQPKRPPSPPRRQDKEQDKKSPKRVHDEAAA